MAIISYGDVIDRQLLPVDAQDIVTKVRLVIAGDLAGESPAQNVFRRPLDGGGTEMLQHVSAPITYVWEAPEHSVYGAERSFALPSGVNPFLSPTDPLIDEPSVVDMSNPGIPSAVRDGDPSTYAENIGGAGGWITYTLDGPSRLILAGFRLQYSFVGGPWPNVPYPAWVRLTRMYLRDGPGYSSDPLYLPGPTDSLGDVRDLYAVAPPDARATVDNEPTVTFGDAYLRVLFQDSEPANNVAVRVHHFYPLLLNEPLLEDIARAQVRLPGVLPQRITVRGVIPPDREHTITGWPGGDYTGVVAQHQYELGRTIIDFEQAGAPVGLPAEAMEAARERKQAIGDTVAVANYNLMMGSRR